MTEVKQAIENFEIATNSKFSVCSTQGNFDQKGMYNENMFIPVLLNDAWISYLYILDISIDKRKILFEDVKCANSCVQIPYTGNPFVILGKKETRLYTWC